MGVKFKEWTVQIGSQNDWGMLAIFFMGNNMILLTGYNKDSLCPPTAALNATGVCSNLA